MEEVVKDGDSKEYEESDDEFEMATSRHVREAIEDDIEESDHEVEEEETCDNESELSMLEILIRIT